RTVLGPSAVRGLDVAVGALKGMGLTDPELIAVIITIQSYVTGTARTEIQTAEAVQETGLSHEAFWEGQQPYLERAMLSGEFPQMAALSEESFATGFDHFGFGLRRLIDGFDVLVRQRAEENAKA
ncbi:MAG TPA: TetR/AcrR family transcriptional regulator C-terminal domain-containing protein, partial [Streptomyces sp.]|nr:TetR/AcrR family transcriptional regulator C-terminal domain-containing protein [Streptomyces sp.]